MNVRTLLFSLVLIAGVTAPSFAVAPATGRMTLTFTEHSPLSKRELVFKRYGARRIPATSPEWAPDVDLASEPFDLFIPPSYKPNVPHGVFIWMGVTEASPEWMDVLARHKLIFLDTKLNNEKTEQGKVRKGLDGVFNLKQRYNIDENRVFIAGFSGGASEATFAIAAFPDAFHGAMFLMGGGFYATTHDDQRRCVPTAQFLSDFRGPVPLEQIKRDYPFVLVCGQRDEFADHALSEYEGLILDGFIRPTYIQVPNIGHNHPNASWFEKVVNALDHPQLKKPPTTRPTNDPHPLPTQVAQAKRYIGSAKHCLDVVFGPKEKIQAMARGYLQRVIDEYPTTPSAAKAREMLKELDSPTTKPSR